MTKEHISLALPDRSGYVQVYEREKDLIPSMSQNTEPHGVVRSSRGSQSAFRAFSEGQVFNGGNQETNGWVEYESCEPISISKVRVDISRRAPNSNVYTISLRSFFILGSKDGESFREIHSQTIGSAGTQGALVIDLKESYQFKVIRLNVKSSVGGMGGGTRNFIVNEFQLIKNSKLFHIYDKITTANKNNSSIHIPGHFEEKIYTKHNFSTKKNLKLFSQSLSKDKLTKITSIY